MYYICKIIGTESGSAVSQALTSFVRRQHDASQGFSTGVDFNLPQGQRYHALMQPAQVCSAFIFSADVVYVAIINNFINIFLASIVQDIFEFQSLIFTSLWNESTTTTVRITVLMACHNHIVNY